MYFPKSQITPNLYTNGKEFAYVNNKQEYIGYYFKVSTGKYFTGTTAVQFGGVYAAFTVNNDTSITAIAPAVPYATTVDITVTNAGGVSTPVQADQFTYYYPQPVITNITPNSGSVYGGDTIVITGTGFAGTQTVKFDTNYVSFMLNSNTQITATTPAVGIPQTVNISITTPGGVSSNSSAGQFTFTSII